MTVLFFFDGPKDSMIQGWYYDPLHGHRLRRIHRLPTPRHYRIVGVYGDDEGPRKNHAWAAHARRDDDDPTLLHVDFAGKPPKTNRFMTARVDDVQRTITWDDGNTWRMLFVHPSQMR